MKLLYCGDVMGRSGREVILEQIPRLKEAWQLDFVIVNGENAAHGFGITPAICQSFYQIGVDVITTGNHVWDQKEIFTTIDQDKRLLRPLNYPASAPGRGYTLVRTAKGKDVLVINVMGRIFMDPLDDPFAAVDSVLKKYPLGGAIGAIVVDIHGEATSEKMTMGHFCDGRVSLVVGSHSHVPTADAQIFEGGTAYQTDAGMCGDYNSVIGMKKEPPLYRFTRKLPSERNTPALGPATLCGVYLETDETTGLATHISAVRIGPRLQNTEPPHAALCS